MKISIIMPFYNGWELTHARLYEFYKYLPTDVEICLVNDCSTDDVGGSVSFWQKGAAKHKILYHKNEVNSGFGASHNAGARIATGDIFVFYSNDVVLSGNFVPTLLEVIERERDKVLVGNRLIYFPAGWNEFEAFGKKRIIPYLEGFFIACTREAWKELGGWDAESYGKFDYEDLDLSTKALSLGYNLVDLQSHFLKHLGGRTIMNMNIDRMEHTKKNREIFIQKWQKFLSEE